MPEEVPSEVLIYGGNFQLSASQVGALTSLVNKAPQVRGMTLCWAGISDHGVKCIVDALKQSTWKAIRMNDRRLYSLDLSFNLITETGISELYSLFFDQFKTAGTVFEDQAPLPTSIRVLTLDGNFIGKHGCNCLGKVLESSR